MIFLIGANDKFCIVFLIYASNDLFKIPANYTFLTLEVAFPPLKTRAPWSEYCNCNF